MALKAAFIVPHPPLIIPEIGKGQEKIIQDTTTAYLKVAEMIAEIKPDTIIIITPHAYSYYDYFCISSGKNIWADFSNYNAKEIRFETTYDNDFISSIIEKTKSASFPLISSGKQDTHLDHATAIPLYFVNQKYQDYKVVKLSLSGLPLKTHYELGKFIDQVILSTNKNYVIISSGDLSHKLKKDGPYGLTQEGLDFDKKFVNIIKSGDLKELMDFTDEFLEQAAECGLRSFVIMAGALSAYNYEKKLLSYEGPFGVGYAVATFMIKDRNNLENTIKTNQDSYIELAKSTIENYVKYRKVIDIPENLPQEMLNKQAGVFVSLKKYGQLRGCIGTIEPTTNSIAEEIIRNAISSATADPRFSSVKENELNALTISVDVLMEATPVQDLSELDVNKYGIIVSKGNRKGLLLPNIEGIDNPTSQIQIALNKARISEFEDYYLEKFEVIRHE